MIFGYQPVHADNQWAGNTISHMKTWGYRWKYKSKYVITPDITIIKTYNLIFTFLLQSP